MASQRGVGELIRADLFDMPGRAADPAGNFVAARHREDWMLERARTAQVAQGEADQSLAILSVAAHMNFDVLTALDHTTQDRILAVHTATPTQVLAALAASHRVAPKK